MNTFAFHLSFSKNGKQLDEIVGVPNHEWWRNNALITWFEEK